MFLYMANMIFILLLSIPVKMTEVKLSLLDKFFSYPHSPVFIDSFFQAVLRKEHFVEIKKCQ